jgi:hypothetical protein
VLDFCVGLDTEFSELIDGSHLYAPTVNIDDVILPVETKRTVLEAVKHFDLYKIVQKNIELEKKIAYGEALGLSLHVQLLLLVPC